MGVPGEAIHITGEQFDAAAAGIDRIIQVEKIRESLATLQDLARCKQLAAANYKEGLAAVASAAGVHAGALRAFVSASIREDFEDKQEAARQLTLLFDEIDL